MIEWYKHSDDDKRAVFQQAGEQVGLSPTAVEKDWWVLIALRAIFNLDVAKHLVFKGGTSLSKAWGIIDRFSEDIDLAIDRECFGFSGDLSKQDVKKLRKASCKYISEDFVKQLKVILIEQGVRDFELHVVPFEPSDTDPVAIELRYVPLTEPISYLQPRILIEISARSLRYPFEEKEIRSMVSDRFPDAPFADPPVIVPTVTPSRTMLEKMFLLHEEFQKPEGLLTRSKRMSRHLYDISRILETEHLEIALSDNSLYETIVIHREKFTKVGWLQDYSLHTHATLSFIPTQAILAEWEADYNLMTETMFYGEVLPFKELMGRLRELNNRINRM